MEPVSEAELRQLMAEDNVDWVRVSFCQKLPEDILREFADKVEWVKIISARQKLSESFIREFKDKVDWVQISRRQKLSESFIREFKDKVDWVQISVRQKLSEDFIREFKDELDIRYINLYQHLSNDFLKEFKLQRLYVKIIHNAGNHNRYIYRLIETPELIHIGCFRGTQQEAIDAIRRNYDGEDMDEYISKVNECFED
ncbi:MAG: hypothetical protein WC136_04945 [Sphaerochaeta sp.]|jgi:hypothetical protein